MNLSTPILFNITLHAISDFSYCDQGIVTLIEQNGQWQMRFDLAEQGRNDLSLHLTRFESGRAFGFSSRFEDEAPGEAMELLVSELGPALCISGQGSWPGVKQANKDCFLVGYALKYDQ